MIAGIDFLPRNNAVAIYSLIRLYQDEVYRGLQATGNAAARGSIDLVDGSRLPCMRVPVHIKLFILALVLYFLFSRSYFKCANPISLSFYAKSFIFLLFELLHSLDIKVLCTF